MQKVNIIDIEEETDTSVDVNRDSLEEWFLGQHSFFVFVSDLLEIVTLIHAGHGEYSFITYRGKDSKYVNLDICEKHDWYDIEDHFGNFRNGELVRFNDVVEATLYMSKKLKDMTTPNKNNVV